MTHITKDELIDLLNKDLSLEHTAMVQYIQHQGVWKGTTYQSIA
jgi:bacterioferritin (cytochrome b1)